MKHHREKILGLGIFFLLGVISIAAHADRDGRERHEFEHNRGYERAKLRELRHDELRFDQRFRHNHYYPRFGQVITVLPEHYQRFRFHNAFYFYLDGVWYRPNARRYVVIAPPVGIVVTRLPAFYTTVWWSGIPYYYANDTYYVWQPEANGYVVTAPPEKIEEQAAAPASDELFIYPAKGQGEKQQADDRYACHRWGVSQTGFDPSLPPKEPDEGSLTRKRADYQKAMRACLEGRGYTVR